MTVAVPVAVFVVVYALIATEKVHRTLAALAGAGVVVALGVVDADDIFYSEETGIDWNVIFLLFGMMVIVSVLRGTGVFEYVAIWAAKRAKGNPYGVMALLCLITAFASMGLDNVTTVLLIAPVTILVCQRIGVRPELYLIAEVLASNIGGTATLVGDPPNIIIASRSGLTFNDFLAHLMPVVLVILVVFVGLCRVLFRHAFEADPARVREVMRLNERDAIEDVSLLVRSLVVLALVLAGFVLHTALHLEPSVVALLGAGVLILVSGVSSDRYLSDVEWESLLFFGGLFILVGALAKVGVIESIAESLADTAGGNLAVAVFSLLLGSAVISAFIDNIPYVATMAPVVGTLVNGQGPLAGEESLWWALALGADLGGNATAIGASANVVVISIAKRNGYPISFWQFTKYGTIVTVMTMLVCVPYMWLRYL
jgi:Na+/H+ antiporter NhaD/arsenite permease-like protein